MTQYRYRQELLVQAFERARIGEHAEQIDLTPITGMSIDALSMILKKTELLRDTYGRGYGPILRNNVRKAASASGLPADRAYAYEVVAMNFYGILKELRSRNQKAVLREIAEAAA